MHFGKWLCERYVGYAYELDLLKFEIDKRIYYYGDHFKNHSERLLPTIKRRIGTERSVRLFKKARVGAIRRTSSNRIVMKDYSNSLFSEPFRSAGYTIEAPAYEDSTVLNSGEGQTSLKELAEKLTCGGIDELLSPDIFNKIAAARAILLDYYRDASYRGLFVPYDIPFWERLYIDVFKELKKAAVVYIHGIPGIYNGIDYNRGNYLIVWGEKIRQNFIIRGVPAAKIFVVCDPKYARERRRVAKPVSLDDVLIITKSATGGQYGDSVILQDRGNLLMYLYMAQAVLASVGVRSARFRPHPSENPEWYLRNIDKRFFSLDDRELSPSLEQASLVIGPSSTVMFDSIMQGTPYLLFEPSINGVDLINYQLVDPFDGGNPMIPLARNEDELRHFVKNRICVDPDVLPEYCSNESDMDALLSRLS